LFRRYSARHLRFEAQGPALTGADGSRLGTVERIALIEDRLRVEGHARAARVALELGGRRRLAVPERRPDGQPGFRLDLPFVPGTPMLELETDSARIRLPLAPPPALRLWLGRAALLPGFGLRSAAAVPAALRWFRHHDPVARAQVKRIFDLDPVEEDRRLEPEIFAPAPDAPPAAAPPGPVTVILPVYQAYDLLADCLDRLVRHSDLPWRLIAIEDASPDPRVAPWLRDWAAARAARVTLLENGTNLGFIGSVNRGLAWAREHAPETPVVLLNSDALVPSG